MSLENNIHVISNVAIRRFTGTGITLDMNHDTAIIRNSLITSTNSILFVSGGWSAIELLNNTFQHNGNSTYEASGLVSSVNHYASFYANGNIFKNNDVKTMLKFFISRDVARSVINIANNDILNNTCENLVDVEHTRYYSCIPNSLQTIVLANNQWRNNRMRSTSVTFKQTTYCFGHKTNILFLENDFLNNSGMSIVEIISSEKHNSSGISLLHNRFFNNTAENLVDITTNIPLVFIRSNTLEHNEVDKSIFNLATEDLDYHSNYTFSRNSLVANGVRRRYPLSYNAFSVAAVISSCRQISVTENFFQNPLFPWEFMLTASFRTYEIDAKYNWWGSKDENEIVNRIFDFRWRNYLARLSFSPFLASANLSDVFVMGDPRVNFRNGSVLGGYITDYIVLEKGDSPYTVTRDVVIYPNASLTIKKGVQINVLPDIGFHVYGKLELLGEWDNPIQFDLITKFEGFANFGAYPLRLVNGSKPWEGIVEIFYNNTWGTICDDGYSSSNGVVLCKQLGYQGYSGSYNNTPSSSSTKPVWWRLRCNSGIHRDITTCPFQGWGVSCYRSQWAVRCNPGYWRGIRFRETATASKISHVKLERGGGQVYDHIDSYVLHFDVLRQSLSDVEIRNSFRGGIKIALQEPGFVISNVVIQNPTRNRNNDHYYYYYEYHNHGIATSLTLTCYNCSVYGKYAGLYFVEFGTQNFLDDHETKLIDSLVVPEFILRKEIPMCEQNMTVVIGNDDMKIITMSKLHYSYEDVECFLTLATLSRITLVATEISSSLDETFNISTSNLNSSNTKEFTISQHDVYSFGPGNLILRYWRKARSRGSRKRFVIFTSRGNVLVS